MLCCAYCLAVLSNHKGVAVYVFSGVGKNNKSLSVLLRTDRDKLGGGSSPRSLSRLPALGAHQAAGSPTLLSMASGVFGLIAGPFRTLRSLNYWVRLLSPLQPVFAAPACRPGKDTFARHLSLYHLAPRQPSLLAVRLRGATGLAPLTPQVAFSPQARGHAFQDRRHGRLCQSCLF